MKKFDYSFLDNGLLPANLVNLTSVIYSLKTSAKIRKDEYKKIFIELEKIAKVQSIKSSNAIEGIITSDERIREIEKDSDGNRKVRFKPVSAKEHRFNKKTVFLFKSAIIHITKNATLFNQLIIFSTLFYYSFI